MFIITKGTAIAVCAGDTVRQEAIYVHDANDEFGDGDAIIFGVTAEQADDLTDEDIIDMMIDSASTDHADLETFRRLDHE